MRRALRIVLASLSVVSLAFAMLVASGYDCSAVAAPASMTTGSVHGTAHDCGDPGPTAPAPGHHDCKMLGSCATVSLSATVLADAGVGAPQVRPDVDNDSRPSDVLRAPVAPPPRA
ncbi:MAG: hypothetical protein K8S21_03855 [Gemmatimonadetes bacterium]|nr:hypothetical protein [Gemmatimonadota bacterium]